MHTFVQKPKAPQQPMPVKSTVSGRASFGQSREVNSVLHLQRTIGHQALQHPLQAGARDLEGEWTGTATRGLGHNFSEIPIHASAANVIQTKLMINSPGDSYEQEADRVSEQITRMPEPGVERKCACGGTPGPTGECEECRKKRLSLQRMSLDVADPVANGFAPSIVQDVLRSPARPLDPQTRAFMEPHFGYDFSQVRIHDDPGASHAADSVQAQAFTVGSDIVFGSGRFAPSTSAGRKLLAHELTHVVQQGRGASSAKGDPSALLQKKETSAQPTPEVKVDPGATCNLNQHRKIEPAAYKANEWLSRAISALDAFLSGTNRNQAQAALNKHFHSNAPAVVTYIRDRLKTIRSDVFTRQNFRVNCPPASDAVCGERQGSEEFVAAVPEGNQNEINLCAPFFERSEEDRASTIIHEFGHAQLGLSAKQQIVDRGYQWDVYYAYLTTGEALTNAESYAMFAREVATGFSPAQAFIVDSLRNCPDTWVPIISDALSKARAWNHRAAAHTPARHPFSKAYKILDTQLRSGDSYKCIPKGDGRCSKRVVAYWYALGDLRICPSLIGLPTPDERALSLLASLYGYKDLVDGDDKRDAAAREARRLHTAHVPTTADVLAGP